MSRVLVTGGAGFIGSHVAELLLRQGYQVTVLDNLSTGKAEWVPRGAYCIWGDVTDLATVRQAMAGIDGVFHLAAMSRVLPSLSGGPAACAFSAEQNILGTLNVLIAAAEAKSVRKVVYSASSTYYGNTPAPHYEEMLPACHTPYGISKYVGELYCRQFSRMYALPTVNLRYFQVYGPRCPSKGEYAMVSSIFIEQALRGKPLTIHGDGSQRRDFVHVDDVAAANVRAFESRAGDGEVINVGRGESFSIQELADLISANQVHVAARAFDMKETLADTDKCRQILRWTPAIGFAAGTGALMRTMGLTP